VVAWSGGGDGGEEAAITVVEVRDHHTGLLVYPRLSQGLPPIEVDRVENGIIDVPRPEAPLDAIELARTPDGIVVYSVNSGHILEPANENAARTLISLVCKMEYSGSEYPIPLAVYDHIIQPSLQSWMKRTAYSLQKNNEKRKAQRRTIRYEEATITFHGAAGDRASQADDLDGSVD
jgi:hypothetical protein